MKLYADLPVRRTSQIAADVFAVGWTVLWVRLGFLVRDATLSLTTPARQLEGAGTQFSSTMSQAGSVLQQVPFVGEDLQKPFTSAAGTGGQITAAGRQLGQAVERLATVLGIVTTILPIVLVLSVWLLLRIRYVRRATAAQHIIDAEEDLDLFALRALTRRPMYQLARIAHDPAVAWRRQDRQVMRRLALMEIRSIGLRPPADFQG